MSRDAVLQLTERWMNDASFREAVRRDPEGAVRATGAALDEDEWAALRNFEWSLSDEELTARVSKSKDLCISICLC